MTNGKNPQGEFSKKDRCDVGYECADLEMTDDCETAF